MPGHDLVKKPRPLWSDFSPEVNEAAPFAAFHLGAYEAATASVSGGTDDLRIRPGQLVQHKRSLVLLFFRASSVSRTT